MSAVYSSSSHPLDKLTQASFCVLPLSPLPFPHSYSCRPLVASGTAPDATGRLQRRSSSVQACNGGSRRTTTRCAPDWRNCCQRPVGRPQRGPALVQQPPTTPQLQSLPRRRPLTTLLQKSHRKCHRRQKKSLLVQRRQNQLLQMLNQRRRHLVRLEQKKTCPCATHCSQSWEAMTNPGPSCNPSTPSSSRLTRRSSRHRWTSQPSERSSTTACKHSITLIPPFQQFVSIRIVVSYSDPHLFAPGTSYGTSFVRT